MSTVQMEQKIAEIIDSVHSIVIVQPDNPDGDSLASSLSLEQILGEMGKTVHLYCGTAVPSYLRYLPGWDRVHDQLPHDFEASIIVDCSSLTLLEQLQKTGAIAWLKTKPCIVLDHHTEVKSDILFSTVNHNVAAVSTGEVIYELTRHLSWPRTLVANNMIFTSIFSDSLGLTSENTTSRSINIITELVEEGINIPFLEASRRGMQKKSPELLNYKADLLKRVEYSDDQRISFVSITWEEIEKYSHQYNPSVLVLDEMRQVEKVSIAIAFKMYPDGKITAKLRANYGYPIASDLAKHFGGGGHKYASGFKITDGRPFNEIKSECISKAQELIDTLKEETDDENTQYAYSVS